MYRGMTVIICTDLCKDPQESNLLTRVLVRTNTVSGLTRTGSSFSECFYLLYKKSSIGRYRKILKFKSWELWIFSCLNDSLKLKKTYINISCIFPMLKFVDHPPSLRSKLFFSIYLLNTELQFKLVDFIRVDVCTLFSNCFHASVQF